MVNITLPDGSVRQFDGPVTGDELAASISKSLAKAAIAVKVDGQLRDIYLPIEQDATVEIVTRESADGVELLRHDAAHVMAEAVKELYPDTQVTIGPTIENGFYYDFAREEPFTPEDLERIEARMREIVKRDEPIAARSGGATMRCVLPRQGERTRRRSSPAFRRRGNRPVPPGRVHRPVPRAAPAVDGQARHGVQADQAGRRLLARRFQQRDAAAHLRHLPGPTTRSSRPTSSASRRPRSATTAGSAARWTCSICRKKAPARCSGTPRAGPCSRP
jgi:hypothetical protein